MKAVGIIAEYNPYHNGHAWHVQQAKERTGCYGAIAVMSGHFLQRGEPASFDKWRRAHMAVANGVDLVIELPVAFSVQSAQYFAEGGVRLLSSLGIVSHLCFGAEFDDVTGLWAAARSLHTGDDAVSCLKHHMKDGTTYAKAFSLLMANATGLNANVLSSPNNILAIEYLRAIDNFAPQIQPVVIKRNSANFHDTDIQGTFASATAIRKSLEENGLSDERLANVLPASSLQIMRQAIQEGYGPVKMEDFSQTLLALLRTLPLSELEKIPGVSEGLHYKLYSSALQAYSLTSLLSALKSKRYPTTRLQRLLIHCLLSTKKAELKVWSDAGPLYARVLAFNEKGRKMLNVICQTSTFPVITKTAAAIQSKTIRKASRESPLQKMLALDIRASDMYALAMPNPFLRSGGLDFLTSPVYAGTLSIADESRE